MSHRLCNNQNRHACSSTTINILVHLKPTHILKVNISFSIVGVVDKDKLVEECADRLAVIGDSLAKQYGLPESGMLTTSLLNKHAAAFPGRQNDLFSPIDII